MFLPLLSILSLYTHSAFARSTGSGVFQRTSNDSTLTGDSQCVQLMCVSATVNGSSVEYVLQSTGAQTLGWMAMGFGNTMANSPMVIMWPNSDSSVTLSQRITSAEVMPTVQSNPPRTATLATTLSSISGTQPKLVYTIPANSDTQQDIIWAFGTTNPDSSAVNANLQQHLGSGTLTLDLTKAISSTSNSTNPATGSPGSSGFTGIPLTSTQKMIVAHGILCTIGFLLLLPAGALLARYARTFTNKWFVGHSVIQFWLSGPVIITGFALGCNSVSKMGGVQLGDDHKRCGVAIFALYFAQCILGGVIHWVKPKMPRSRPPQNYMHAITGLLIIALAFYQVRTGYRTEWPLQTGRGSLPNSVNIVWYVWVVLIPVLYFAGLALLPRQFKLEQASRKEQPMDE